MSSVHKSSFHCSKIQMVKKKKVLKMLKDCLKDLNLPPDL